MTDSGAFQGFTRQLFLKNKKIISFQEQIGADIISPLDLVTPPNDNRTTAENKLRITLQRIQEGKEIVSKCILAGVQQGGRFHDLRQHSIEELMKLNVEYIAIGSLVPFFNRNRNIEFAGNVLRDARSIAGSDIPIHVYGAGDPAELPFFFAMGADIFDSSSYGHYAEGGWYMTPFGAINDPSVIHSGEFECGCFTCSEAEKTEDIFESKSKLAIHNLWTILETIRKIRAAVKNDSLNELLETIMEKHRVWFPKSNLMESWNTLNN